MAQAAGGAGVADASQSQEFRCRFREIVQLAGAMRCSSQC